MLEISNVKIALDAMATGNNEAVCHAVADRLGIDRSCVRSCAITKRSVDARKKQEVHFVITALVELVSDKVEGAALSRHAENGRVKKHKPYQPLAIPRCTADDAAAARPVVIGSGPAGLAAAYYLAEAGLKPIVYERGEDVDARLASVAAFNKEGLLSENSNVSFGEGGAGTFSDGKLATNIKDPHCASILHWFVNAGAPEEILTEAKPHIGTDRLVGVVRNLRNRIVDLGGEFHFGKKLNGFRFENGRLRAIEVVDIVSGKAFDKEATRLVLATGHAARDTFTLLDAERFLLEQKPFSIGVRIEHLQERIDRAQYGKAARHPALGAADYRLVTHLPNGRGVYTFCMCPGGEVVCASNEPHTVVVNGMSRYARDGRNANAAVLVEVGPGDFGSTHPLAGIAFQRTWEQAAYRAGSAAQIAYQAPAQTVGGFLAASPGKPSSIVQPSYARGVVWCELRTVLPPFVSDSLQEALPIFGRKLQGFDDREAVMTGVETRSSSPVRIRRGGDHQAFVGMPRQVAEGTDQNKVPSSNRHASCDPARIPAHGGSGIYPCGEGAGYAGGIMSAAVDGVHAAEALVRHILGSEA